MVKAAQTIFKYKITKSPLHKLPAMLKLFIILPLSILCVTTPILQLTAGIFVLITAAFLCGFTLREQLTDLKPAAFYAVFMYALSALSTLMENLNSLPMRALITAVLIPHNDFIRISLRLVFIVQLSSLLFRTTTSMELRNGLHTIESFIRHILKVSPKPRFSQTICLFLCFIPEIFQTWTNINIAWKARGGKQGLIKVKTLVFVLFSINFEKAALKAKALEARGIK